MRAKRPPKSRNAGHPSTCVFLSRKARSAGAIRRDGLGRVVIWLRAYVSANRPVPSDRITGRALLSDSFLWVGGRGERHDLVDVLVAARDMLPTPFIPSRWDALVGHARAHWKVYLRPGSPPGPGRPQEDIAEPEPILRATRSKAG